jgi:hypothetical protein
VGEQVKTPQQICNAATRALLNNAARSSGSQVVVDAEAVMPAKALAEKLASFIPRALMRRVVLPPGNVSFAQLAAVLASALQDLHGRLGLDLQIQRLNGDVCRILLGYYDIQASMMALEVGLELATAFFNEVGGRAVDLQPIEARMQMLASMLLLRQPDQTTRALMRVARARGIPVYPVSPGSRIWLYGQGRAGLHGFVAASHRDSLSGFNLARNKLLASQLIVQLGFPGAGQQPCRRAPACAENRISRGHQAQCRPARRGCDRAGQQRSRAGSGFRDGQPGCIGQRYDRAACLR